METKTIQCTLNIIIVNNTHSKYMDVLYLWHTTDIICYYKYKFIYVITLK